MSGPFGSQQWMYASGGFYSHPIDQSLRFNDDDFGYLERTPASAGNRKTWTWSGWVKRGNIGSTFALLGASSNFANTDYFNFNGSDKLQHVSIVGGQSAVKVNVTTDAVFRDTSAWYHVVLVNDYTEATGSDRVKIYVNGVRQSVTYSVTPSSTDDTMINSANPNYIGRTLNNSNPQVSFHHDGYMAEVNFIDGQALDASYFGETKSGVWIPKRYSGSYGTNGFYLPFKNATISNETDSATVTAPFGGTAANGKDPDGNFVTSNTSTGSSFTLIQYDLGAPKQVTRYDITSLSFTGNTSTFQVQYSNDNSSWTAATSLSVTSSSQDFAAGLNVTARYWRIRATAFGVNGSASIDAFQLFSGTVAVDGSGNGNDFSSVGLLPADLFSDSPTNNWSVLNPVADSGSGVYSEGNLKCLVGASTYPVSSIAMSGGKWYCEAVGLNSGYGMMGIIPASVAPTQVYPGAGGSLGYGYYFANGNLYAPSGVTSYGSSYTSNDIISIALDLDGGTLTFYKNGVSQGTAATGITGEWVFAFSDATTSAGIYNVVTNFGQDSSFAGNKTAQGNTDANGIGDFYYSPPSGYLALCTANLPDPAAAIDPALDANPQDYFNTVLYTGTGTQQSITGVGFQPDWLWIKKRSVGSNHQVVNAIRGATEVLEFDNTDAELNTNNRVKSIDSDGFTVGGRTEVNGSGNAFVAWSWKMDGAGSANSDGSITTLATSANQDLGISMIHYRADGNSSGTVGTGLDSSKPIDMAIVKKRNGTSEYQVGHRFSGQGSNFAYHSEFNHTTVLSGIAPYFMGSQSTTNGSLLYLSSGATSTSTDRFFCWVFQSVEGFSKFGGYTGNASSDGPFVYTGFRPAFLIIKNVDSADQWFLNDNKRDSYNVVDEQILVNSSVAESTSRGIDFLSNGFKIRDASTTPNGSGNTMIYMAFAEMPFKYANAR